MGPTFLGRWAEKASLRKLSFEQKYERGENADQAAVWRTSAPRRGKI